MIWGGGDALWFLYSSVDEFGKRDKLSRFDVGSGGGRKKMRKKVGDFGGSEFLRNFAQFFPGITMPGPKR